MIKIYIIVITMLFSAFSGWYVEHLRFTAFETEVKAIAQKQEEHVKGIEKQQSLITQQVKTNYETKLTALRNSYSSRMSGNASVSQMPIISCTSSGSNETTTNGLPDVSDQTIAQLPEQCAETTLQLKELQNWIRQQQAVEQ
jgi:hypothetical protein